MTKLVRDARHGVGFELDGRRQIVYVEPRTLLSDALRHEAGATGVHVGCEHGVCGACTVRVDGVLTRSCLMFAVQANGAVIETVASLGQGELLSDLQSAFKRHHALQCGYCTPGILLSAVEFLAQDPDPDEAMVRDMLSGHLCRCTGYTNIVQAILDVARSRRGCGA